MFISDCSVLSFSLLKMLKNGFVSCLGINDRFSMRLHSLPVISSQGKWLRGGLVKMTWSIVSKVP